MTASELLARLHAGVPEGDPARRRDALERGESVKLSGFGNFQLRDKPQRPGRNPKTGQEIPISARRVVTFHASQKLKAMVDSATRRASVHAG
jgi:integration host factor subunit alpha